MNAAPAPAGREPALEDRLEALERVTGALEAALAETRDAPPESPLPARIEALLDERERALVALRAALAPVRHAPQPARSGQRALPHGLRARLAALREADRRLEAAAVGLRARAREALVSLRGRRRAGRALRGAPERDEARFVDRTA